VLFSMFLVKNVFFYKKKEHQMCFFFLILKGFCYVHVNDFLDQCQNLFIIFSVTFMENKGFYQTCLVFIKFCYIKT